VAAAIRRNDVSVVSSVLSVSGGGKANIESRPLVIDIAIINKEAVKIIVIIINTGQDDGRASVGYRRDKRR